MKLIYKYHPTKFNFIGTDEIADDVAVPSNATLVPLPNPCYNPTFDPQAQIWHSVSEADYLQSLEKKAEGRHAVETTTSQQLLMDQHAAIATLQKDLKKLQETVTALQKEGN